MKKVGTKTFSLIIIILLIIFNSVVLFSYYNFYISDKISSDLITSRETNHNELYNIANNLRGYNIYDSIEILKKYVKEKGGYVSIETMDGNILYTNKKDINKLFSSSGIIIIDGLEYELTYSKLGTTPGIKFIRNLMLFEILLLALLVLIVFIINSKQIINPVRIITKDINDYKYGIIPKKKKMPKSMEKIQNTFVDMVDELEVEKENQNQIIAAISHDIKTPLTSVIGYANMLDNNKISDEKKKIYIDKIYNKALLMKDILEEFDDYQSCNIKETLKKDKINIKDLTNILSNDYLDDLKNKKIDLTIKSFCDNEFIEIDLVKIKRVFGNIISNSVTHFNNKKGKIDINIRKEDDLIRFEVADDGGGIEDEKNLIKIFEPFYTSDPSRKISGLGLSICRQIINAHNGTIYAENNKIGGLSIIFILKI